MAPEAARPPRPRTPRVPIAPETPQGMTKEQIDMERAKLEKARSLPLAPEGSVGGVANNPLVVWSQNGTLHVALEGAGNFVCGKSKSVLPTMPVRDSAYPAEWCLDCQNRAQGRTLVASR